MQEKKQSGTYVREMANEEQMKQQIIKICYETIGSLPGNLGMNEVISHIQGKTAEHGFSVEIRNFVPTKNATKFFGKFTPYGCVDVDFSFETAAIKVHEEAIA